MVLLYIRNYSLTRDTYISLCTTLSLPLLGSTRFTGYDTRTNYYFARPDSHPSSRILVHIVRSKK